MFNQKSILKFELISTIFIMISGVILHFVYEWSGNNVFIEIISPVNESVWEHLKLLFFPITITLLVGYFYIGKNYENYICAKTLGIIFSMIFTVITFYTYVGVLGTNIDFINIALFFISVILGQYISYKNISLKKACDKKRAIIILVFIFFLFIIFTFYPPSIGLFEAPEISISGVFYIL